MYMRIFEKTVIKPSQDIDADLLEQYFSGANTLGLVVPR